MSQRPKSEGLALRQEGCPAATSVHENRGRVYTHERETLYSARLTGCSWTIKDVSVNEEG